MNYTNYDDIKKAEESALNHRGTFVEYLISEGLTSEDIIGQAIAESFKIPYSNLNAHQPSKEQVLLIPENIAKEFPGGQ